MKKKQSRITKRRLRSSYFTSVISISLLLFLLGLLGLLLLNAKRLSDFVKENISISIILKDDIKEVDIRRLQKDLDAANYVKSTEYVSKEEAARRLQEELGEDFINFLGYNPLLASIDVYFYADFANPDSIAEIESRIINFPEVKEVFYQKSLIHLVNENVRKISFFILIFSALLFVIAMTLINNTIRLSVYARRFIINTMQLVGATHGFIRRPFLMNSIMHGIYGALIASGLLAGLIYLIQREFIEIISFQDVEILGVLFILVLVSGIMITWISTFFAVNKYLRVQEDDLYY
ncbi:MAG: cell division protein FtsX [Bacteroidales bacterium]|nr:MAG: cell division protein FtsX [Bacteroidales bacterium]